MNRLAQPQPVEQNVGQDHRGRWLEKLPRVEDARRPDLAGGSRPSARPSRPPASPEAPPAVGGAVRALAHGHHLSGAEGLPQEHGEGALDVQDGGGPLGREAQAGEPRPAAPCPDGRNDGGLVRRDVGSPAPTDPETATNANPLTQQSERARQDQRQKGPAQDSAQQPPLSVGSTREGWGLGPTSEHGPCKGQPPPGCRQNVGPPPKKGQTLDFYMKSLPFKILHYIFFNG